jgi:hypothetical protein
MNTKTTFVNRSTNVPQKVQNSIDALKIIEYVLSLSPYNRIIPNSTLYNMAVKQYNNIVAQNTLERPQIPAWFCGKIDETNGLLLEIEPDATLRLSTGVIQTPTTITPEVSGAVLTYPPDECLAVGTPGSSPYAKCQESQEEDTNVGDINWADSVYSSSTPTIPTTPIDSRKAPKWHVEDNLNSFLRNTFLGFNIGALISPALGLDPMTGSFLGGGLGPAVKDFDLGF